ncbi:MAG: phenylalanine--tRNA ligase subunit alpha, partial [Alphaproteobacteria bacterium]|nr:phenylalanine--tRNA ligase subunit alpha [Alphaproteobacteria bacterium]
MSTIDADAIERALLAEIAAAADPDALEAVRVAALGRRGSLTEQMKGLGALDPEARRQAGQALNRVKDAVSAAIEARKTELEGVA